MTLKYVVLMFVIRVKQMDGQQYSSLKHQRNAMVKDFQLMILYHQSSYSRAYNVSLLAPLLSSFVSLISFSTKYFSIQSSYQMTYSPH